MVVLLGWAPCYYLCNSWLASTLRVRNVHSIYASRHMLDDTCWISVILLQVCIVLRFEFPCFVFFLIFLAPCASCAQDQAVFNVTAELVVKGMDICTPKTATLVFENAITFYEENYGVHKSNEHVVASSIKPISEGVMALEFSNCPIGTKLSFRALSPMLDSKGVLSFKGLHQPRKYAAAAQAPVDSNSNISEKLLYFYVGDLTSSGLEFVGHAFLSISPQTRGVTYEVLSKSESIVSELSTDNKLYVRYVYYTTASENAIKTAGDATLTVPKVVLISLSLV